MSLIPQHGVEWGERKSFPIYSRGAGRDTVAYTRPLDQLHCFSYEKESQRNALQGTGNTKSR